MKIRLARKPFAVAMKSLLPIACNRRSLPILACFRLEARASTLTIEATDLETTIRRRVGDVEVARGGSILVPAKALCKVMESAPEDEVSLDTQDGRTVVQLGSRSITFEGSGDEEWPTCGTGTPEDPHVLVAAEVLGEAFARACLCASKDEARPVLTSIAMQLEQGSSTLQVVASDSFRLGALDVPLCEPSPVTDLILIPARTLRLAATQMRKGGGIVGMRLHDGADNVTFDHAATTWTIRRMQGEFPNWREIIPTRSDVSASLDAAEIATALKTIAAVRTAPGVPVRLRFGPSCSLALVEQGGAQVSEALTNTSWCSGEREIEVAFNPDYLADALHFVGSEQVDVQLQDGIKASVFGTPERRYVLMPVRI